MNRLLSKSPFAARQTSPSRNDSRPFLTALWSVGLLAISLLGCVPRRSSPIQSASNEPATARAVDETTLAFESLRSLNHPAALEKDQMGRIVGNIYAAKATSFLNQWLSRQDLDAVKWQLDPLFNQLPRSLREHPYFQGLDQLDFYNPDVIYLQQCLWQNDIAQRVGEEPASPQFAEWLDELEKSGKVDAGRQLRQAERLFDWTVRNIQLTPLLPPPKGPALTVEEGKRIDTRSPAERGIPGPGYQQLPQQTLLYGQGDAWERGRMFLQLCRQAELAAAMLGISYENELSGPRAWVAAVLVDGELYLFDPLLGLPIPGPERQGIATLSQFVADESLLQALQAPGGEPYRVSAGDLKSVGVLFDVQPEGLSRRMLFLEGPLNEARRQSRSEQKTDDDEQKTPPPRIVLTQSPSQLEPTFRKLKHISSVGLWRVPFEAIQYAQALPEIASKDPDFMQRILERESLLNAEQMVYLGTTPAVDRSLVAGQEQRQRTPRNVTLNQGRDYTLRGRFEDWEGRPGARSVYLSFRPSEQEIDLHESSIEFLRKKYGMNPRWEENPKQRADDMARMGKMMRLSKAHATYWLGLTYFETGEYQNAIQWLEPLARGEADTAHWQPGARYITARSYEALGNVEKATELYLTDDSPQAAGNKLRAEWLKKKD